MEINKEMLDSVISGNRLVPTKASKNAKGKTQKASFYERILEEAGVGNIATALLSGAVGKFSDSIEIVGTLGYREKGLIKDGLYSVVVNGKRTVCPCSAVVGYLIKNVGKVPVLYCTEEFYEDNTGIHSVANMQYKTLQPNDTVQISRKFLALMALLPDFNLRFANGRMQVKNYEVAPINTILNGMYFVFGAGSYRGVHSPECKIEIYDEITEKGFKRSRVKPEYIEVFGGLEALSRNYLEEKVSGSQKSQKYHEARLQKLEETEELQENPKQKAEGITDVKALANKVLAEYING